MNQEEVLKLIEELSRRHGVPKPKVEFRPTPLTHKEKKKTRFGTLTIRHIMKGAFIENPMTGEVWIEFYGSPTKHIVIHEFKHYLDHLGVSYIKKSKS
jgi:hypothetical protein